MTAPVSDEACRLLVVLGSGETAPTMAATHRAVFARLGTDPDARVLDTTYGFQENAEAITARIRNYFADQVGVAVRPLTLLRAPTDGLQLELALAAVRRADWVFAGPGSPSYTARQLAGGPLVDALRAKLRDGGALVFASAAACTLGPFSAPIYELYKAGEEPHWVAGLDLLAEAGLNAVVLPHFDNTEGGSHDTRFCYLGERRLRLMESQLPDDVWVLGVDEHTAAVIDLDEDTVSVRGRGRLTVRSRRRTESFPPGAAVPLERLRSAAQAASRSTPEGPAAASAGRTPAGVTELEQRFTAALRRGDAMTAVSAALDAERLAAGDDGGGDPAEQAHARRALRSMLVDLATLAQDGLHDHRRLVAPLVDALLALRADAREQGDYALSDTLRDRLAGAGVQVRDTPDGPAWTFEEPGP